MLFIFFLSIWVVFTFRFKNSFRISWSAYLLLTVSLIFLNLNVHTLPSLLKYNFALNNFFSFSALNMSFQCLLASITSPKYFVVPLLSPNLLKCFALASLKMIFLSLAQQLSLMHLDMFIFIDLDWYLLNFLDLQINAFYQIWKILDNIFKYFFCLFDTLISFWDYNHTHVKKYHRFCSYFPLCSLYGRISVDLF